MFTIPLSDSGAFEKYTASLYNLFQRAWYPMFFIFLLSKDRNMRNNKTKK